MWRSKFGCHHQWECLLALFWVVVLSSDWIWSTCDCDPEVCWSSFHHVHPRAVVVPAVVGGVAGEELAVHGEGGSELMLLPVIAIITVAHSNCGSMGDVGHNEFIVKSNCFFIWNNISYISLTTNSHDAYLRFYHESPRRMLAQGRSFQLCTWLLAGQWMHR